jgi:hypothetical protein
VSAAPPLAPDVAPERFDAVVPGDGLLHPLALAAVGVLLVNDHILKWTHPGVLTGKFSDVAGLAFFPLFLVAAWEIGTAVVHRWAGPSGTSLLVATAVTGVAFVCVKTTPEGAAAFGAVLGSAQWLAASAVAVVVAGPPPVLRPAAVVSDPTDLIGLASLTAALAIGYRRIGRAERSEAGS